MNIFVLDYDPRVAAQMMCDKHVVKMIVEGCQMLSTVHHLGGCNETFLYKKSFMNHPCTVWSRASSHNYLWLAQHTYELSNEYTYRYGKTHKAHDLTQWFVSNIPRYVITNGEARTPFAQAMPDQYKVADDAVSAYRNYYLGEKKRFAKWSKRNIPEWYSEGLTRQEILV